MTLYYGEITSYGLQIHTPNTPTNYKYTIYLKGSFGTAFLCFVPEGGTLGTNGKRTGQNIFDIYFWMTSYLHCVDLLRNEKPVYFYYNDTYREGTIGTSDEPPGEAE